jgi:hypothetical protein
MPLDVSIVVLNFNTRDLLAGCIDSVMANTGGLDMELIVVDNASGDGSADMVEREYPLVRLIRNPGNTGFSGGINLGIGAAAAPYILVLNQDTLIKPGAIEHMLEYLRCDPKAGIVGPRLVSGGGRYQQSCNYFTTPGLKNALLLLANMALPHGTSIMGLCADPAWNRAGPVEVDWVHGACILVRREVFDQAGLFDERFYVFMEDMEFCYRAFLAGWKTVYLPGTEIVHFTNRSGIQTIGKLYSYGRIAFYVTGIDYFLRKHFSPAHAYMTIALMAVGSLVLSLLLRLAFLAGIGGEEIKQKIVYSQRMGKASLAGLLAGYRARDGGGH